VTSLTEGADNVKTKFMTRLVVPSVTLASAIEMIDPLTACSFLPTWPNNKPDSLF
jgi:hypothetical protein